MNSRLSDVAAVSDASAIRLHAAPAVSVVCVTLRASSVLGRPVKLLLLAGLLPCCRCVSVAVGLSLRVQVCAHACV